jgi:hypothetical protein
MLNDLYNEKCKTLGIIQQFLTWEVTNAWGDFAPSLAVG